MNKFYAGIGSRATPDNVCQAMTALARVLHDLGYTLRSGHADGADLAFEAGAGDLKEIFLPWAGFNGGNSRFTEPTEAAIEVSRKLFPHFPGVSRGTRMLISRNMHQVLGPEIGISPRSEFVVCWTVDGKLKGGTAYAMKAAKYYDIPIFNLHNHDDVYKLYLKIEDLKNE